MDDAGRLVGYVFHCPGCGHGHIFYVAHYGAAAELKSTWEFNGDLDRPTFSPSLLNTCPDHPDSAQRRCHLHVVDGEIRFAADCAHALRNRVVVMADRGDPEHAGERSP